MSKGGYRKGAGRKEGSTSKRTREIADKAATEGITPLEVMLRTMRALYHRATVGPDGVLLPDNQISLDLLRQASEEASRAAPFMHPRLSTTTVRGEGEGGAVKFVVVGA